MSTPPQDHAGEPSEPRSDDPTRDIRLPSLPHRPAANVPPEWQAQVRHDPPPGETASPRLDPLANQPTDKMSAPPEVRQPTLSFGTPSGGAPAPAAPGPQPDPGPPRYGVPASFGPPAQKPPSDGPAGHGVDPATDRKRRWPWVALTLLPILVIVVAGLLLVLLLGGR